MNRRVTALLLTFCIVFSLLPAAAFTMETTGAAKAGATALSFTLRPRATLDITPTPTTPVDYDLWVNNVRITSSNLTVQCGGL